MGSQGLTDGIFSETDCSVLKVMYCFGVEVVNLLLYFRQDSPDGLPMGMAPSLYSLT